MGAINWNLGQLITLNPGDTANCVQGLDAGQLYALFFYNAASNETATTVNVTSGNQSLPPVTVTVPGTTQNLGLAALCFVNGTDSDSVSAAVTSANQGGSQIQAFIGSVKMPVDLTGINNVQLPMDGSPYPFTAFSRYFAVPESHWYAVQIQSSINQFISVQFEQQAATVFIVNALTPNADPVVQYLGSSQQYVKIVPVTGDVESFNIQGNGQQFVWINADSIQDSETATLTVQSLVGALV
jgi:hypothetical protein